MQNDVCAHALRTRRSAVSPATGAAILLLALAACDADLTTAPTSTAQFSRRSPASAIFDPSTGVTALLDSFSIAGTYTILPRGGYGGGVNYTASPEREQYAGTILRHPTGIDLPVGLPVRLLAEGEVLSTATPWFRQIWCSSASQQSDPKCQTLTYTYTVVGLKPGPGVLFPFSEGSGINVAFARIVPSSQLYWPVQPSAEAYAGPVPASGDTTLRELYVRRSGCCFYPPLSGQPTLETYEGSWRIGAVPDDGGRPELDIDPVVWIVGPRTDAPATEAHEFRVEAESAILDSLTRWWFIQPSHNTFDGIPVNLSVPGTIPRYPSSKRSVVSEIIDCAGQSTCEFQAPSSGAVVAKVTLADSSEYAARNTGFTAPELAPALTCTSGSETAQAGGNILVVRGADLRCELSSEGPFSVDRWTFSAASGSYSVNRDPSLEGPDANPRVWNGLVALAGTVGAVFRVGAAEPQALSVNVVIVPRTWGQTRPEGYPAPIVVGMRSRATRLESPPSKDEELGKVVHYHDDGTLRILNDLETPISGPNAGLAFFKRVPNFIAEIHILVNDEALTRQSAFWRIQPERAPAASDETPCTRSTVVSRRTRELILEHEGDSFQAGSHTQRYRAEYERIVGPRLESFVRVEGQFTEEYQAAVGEMLALLEKASKVADEKNKVPFGCKFKFDY